MILGGGLVTAKMISGGGKFVGKMISRGERSRPPQNHFRNNFKGGAQPPEGRVDFHRIHRKSWLKHHLEGIPSLVHHDHRIHETGL